MRITVDQLRKLAPAASGEIIGAIASLVEAGLLDAYEINTPLRVCHFLAQIAHESDQFRTTVEYASGAAYEGRKDLGNTQPGDGKRYRGRGLIQCTGRANYREFTAWMRRREPDCPDFEANPEVLAQFPWALLSAVWYWTTRGLNALADKDDILAITKRINGGTNGLADRQAKLATATGVWLAGNARPVLREGSMFADDVVELQAALSAALGRPVADFGAATKAAVIEFQRSKGLAADGIVGPKTWGALLS